MVCYKGVIEMEYELNVKSLAIFELKSLLGRCFLKTTPKLYGKSNYLNLGCGSNIIKGYVNADFFGPFKFWKKTFKKEWYLDLRYPLNCEGEVFEGVYSEHTLEHLYPRQADALLRELYRVSKKGAVIRITVPDIERYVNFYIADDEIFDHREFNKRYKNGCLAIRNITQNYFHNSTWDYELLSSSLAEAGFVDIKRMSFNKSRDQKLELDIKERKWETLYVEGVK